MKKILEPSIIHNDAFIIVISKPPGMPSVSLKSGEKGTLASWILDNFPSQADLPQGKLEAGLIQRLDNETSGLIIAARNTATLKMLRRNVTAAENFDKVYLALCIGTIEDEILLNKPIAHHPRKKKKMLVCNSKSEAEKFAARAATTTVKPLRNFKLKNTSYTLCEISIKTGVRHQIRAHMASIGHPISGDDLYMNSSLKDLDTLKPRRHLLHSFRVAIIHPKSLLLESYESPLADDFLELIQRMEEH
ncbi:MAG TPA: RNA pseudouridine synthase [bacterium]|nr:RNA pseudouridine synthase [Myxococcales bacterium]HPW44855.1 RNA pseudouridine synthase [bacterium]HQG13300.1 RNA pseudouridine synthase [bacterium]HQH79804.1 RNA pseudouridine synthase [bacterium]